MSKKRKRRVFSHEFKAKAVQLCRTGSRSVAQVAVDLELTEFTLSNWLKQSAVDAGEGPAGALTTAEKEELTRLRRKKSAAPTGTRDLRSCGHLLSRPECFLGNVE